MDIRDTTTRGRARRAATLLAILFACLATSAQAAEPLPPALNTPQIANALRPLDGIPGKMQVHAAVATMPDPLETRQGRSFDMTLAAGIAGFQAHGYVLDGFALQWPLRTQSGGGGGGTPGAPGDASAPASSKLPGGDKHAYRDQPGVLVFRRDNWRRQGWSSDIAPTEYFLVFVVGESPAYGVQPAAFQAAATCALRLDGTTRAPGYASKGSCLDLPLPLPLKGIDERAFQRELLLPVVGTRSRPDGMRTIVPPACTTPTECANDVARVPATDRVMLCTEGECPAHFPRQLNIIGPSFSGSVQSILSALETLCDTPGECIDLDVLLLSPSATATSNWQAIARGIPAKPAVQAAPRPIFPGYVPLAWGLKTQFSLLQNQLCPPGLPKWKQLSVAVLAEESTYGNEMLAVTRDAEKKGCIRTMSVAQFPPSIASIRTEQARLTRAQKNQRRNLVPGASRLLEFNLDTMDEGIDRPPPYQPEVSSRSDELMLYRTMDAMRLYVKPDVVIIIATEIRDRLFLLGEVRNQLPAAVPVLFEQDYLLVHPDYRKITRGTIVVPTSDPLVCMDTQGLRMSICGRDSQYHPMPSDYAANGFRATSILAEYRRAEGPPSTPRVFAQAAIERMRYAPPNSTRPRVLVATLAGFQGIDGAAAGRFSLAAAETRMVAQLPSYIALTALSAFALFVAFWILRDQHGGQWELSLARQLLNDLPIVRGPGRAKRCAARYYDRDDSLIPTRSGIGLCLLLVLSMFAVAFSVERLIAVANWEAGPCVRGCTDFPLVHGRDGVALACLWLLYGCVAVVGLARVDILDRRFHRLIRQLCPREMRKQFLYWTGARHSWLLPSLAFTGVMLILWREYSIPKGVDPSWPWLLSIGVLALGVVFLAHLIRLHRLQRRLSMSLIRIRSFAGPDWPKYVDIGEPPGTPFNLRLRRVLDLEPLTSIPLAAWVRQTRLLLDGRAPVRGPGRMIFLNGNALVRMSYPMTFEEWQARLVSEMKLIATTIRTTAWCAMLAPIAVLIGTNVYVPIYEGFITSVCIAMLVGTFALTVFIVLRMEGDPMFGPMFTRDGDNLTFGGGLRALWPKFVAMGLVLLPLVAPDMWRWLHGLLRSVNSLQ